MANGSEAVLLAALITTAGTVVVGVGAFVTAQVISTVSARKARRRASVVRILDELDRTVRSSRHPRITTFWDTSVVNVGLATNRLLLDIPKRRTALYHWLSAKTLELANEKDFTQKAAVAGEMSGALTGWYRKSLKEDWFAIENAKRQPSASMDRTN